MIIANIRGLTIIIVNTLVITIILVITIVLTMIMVIILLRLNHLGDALPPAGRGLPKLLQLCQSHSEKLHLWMDGDSEHDDVGDVGDHLVVAVAVVDDNEVIMLMMILVTTWWLQ